MVLLETVASSQATCVDETNKTGPCPKAQELPINAKKRTCASFRSPDQQRLESTTASIRCQQRRDIVESIGLTFVMSDSDLPLLRWLLLHQASLDTFLLLDCTGEHSVQKVISFKPRWLTSIA